MTPVGELILGDLEAGPCVVAAFQKLISLFGRTKSSVTERKVLNCK
jgi:hypothetical protein